MNNKKKIIWGVVTVVIIIGVFVFSAKHKSAVVDSSDSTNIVSDASSTSATTSIVVTKSSAEAPKAPSSDLKVVTEGLALMSPKSGATFGGNDVIQAKIRTVNVVGPIYAFLFNPISKTYFATQAFDKTMFKQNGDTTLAFDLEKNKAGDVIPSGSYKLIVCDHGTVPMDHVCAVADITIHS